MLTQGDIVFYTDNTKSVQSEYHIIAVKSIIDLHLAPIHYLGIDLTSRGSSLDTELRGDFYKAKVVILVLGKDDNWRDTADNWVIPELSHAIKLGIKCLIYTTALLTETENKLLPFNPTFISNLEHFEITLRADLGKLGIK
jgi:hypothetical protein